MKKIKLIAVLLLIQLLWSTVSFADSKPCVYVKDAIKYKNKDTVTVEVYMENGKSEIVTLGLDVFYDKSKLEYVDSKSGKDLNATMQLAENIPEDSRVAIGIMAFSGLKKDGLYYSIDFKVKENFESIPIKINVREATDSKGNDISVDSKDGKITVSQDKVNKKENEETKNENQQINNFEKSETEQIENIEQIVVENGNLEITENDNLSYENGNTDVIEILEDGTIIPNQDGDANVKVKLNNQEIGNLQIKVKDGKIEKIIGDAENLNLDSKSENNTQNETEANKDDKQENLGAENQINNNEETNTKDKANSKEFLSENNSQEVEIKEENKTLKIFAILIVVITILFIIFYFIKKNRGGKK